MNKKIIPLMIGLAGIIGLLEAVSGTLQILHVLPSMLGLLLLIAVYWFLVNARLHKKIDKPSSLILFFAVPSTVTLMAIGAITFMSLDRLVSDIVINLGLAILGGAMVTGAIYLWDHLFPSD